LVVLWILFPPVQEEGEMSTKNQLAEGILDSAKFFAEISAVYVEVLAGLRRPEQLARWLSDSAYYDVCQRHRREAMQRQVTGVGQRPELVLRKIQTFATDDNAYQGVVVLQISGANKAV
jgi:hypothetical protein